MENGSMEFTVELFVSEKTGAKMVFIAADGALGEEYPYETAEDIGNAITSYLSNYYPEEVATAGQDKTEKGAK